MEDTYQDRQDAENAAQRQARRTGTTHVVTGDNNSYEVHTYQQWRYNDEGEYLARFDGEGNEVEVGSAADCDEGPPFGYRY